MGDRLQLALDESSKNTQLAIKAEHAKYGNIVGKNPKNKCIVVLTSSSIQIREENKTVKLKSSYVWYDLLKISINFPFIQFTFRSREKNVKKENNESDLEILVVEIIDNKVRSNNSKNQKENNPNLRSFIQSLSDILQRVLTPSELKKISFYSSIITEKVKPTYVSIMSRLSMIILLHDIQVSPMSIETFKSMLFSHQTVFNLSTFKDFEFIIPILFEILPLIDYLEVLKIPEINNFHVYKAAAHFLFQNDSLKYIEITGQKDDGFNSFLEKIKKSNMKTISYAYSKFSAQDLDLISKSLLESNVHCAEFHNAISENDYTSFYNNFLTPDMCSHLWSLNLNNSINLDLPLLFKKLSNISSLSLAYCGIEINSTIRLIHESDMKYLKYLNLSGNLCKENLDMSVKLPNNLTHIMVNDVSWNDKSLTSFISLVLQLTKNEKNQQIQINQNNPNKKPKDLYLSISHAVTLQHEWSRLFQLLHFNFSNSSRNESFLQYRTSSHSSYNFSELRNAIANDDDDEERFHSVALRSLAWDENPVDTAFFDFLRECKELETLSLNSCFHETLESSLALFVDFIKSNDSIKNLFVAGSKKVHLGKKVIKVIDACLNKRNLKILDLSISKCDSECLMEFLPLFDERKSSLAVVILDGVFPSESDKFVNFLNQIKLMNSKTKISFPNGDCLNLKKQKKIDQKQMDEINKIYQSLEGKEEPQNKVPESDEEKSSSSNNNSKNSISVKPLEHSEFIKQPYFYRYFYEPFIPYYLDMAEVNQIRLNKFDDDQDVKIEQEVKNPSPKAVKKIIKNEEENEDDENDDFTLLPADTVVNEEEEEEDQNKTFTVQMADFDSNVENEEEEDEADSEEAIPIELDNQNENENENEEEENNEILNNQQRSRHSNEGMKASSHSNGSISGNSKKSANSNGSINSNSKKSTKKLELQEEVVDANEKLSSSDDDVDDDVKFVPNGEEEENEEIKIQLEIRNSDKKETTIIKRRLKDIDNQYLVSEDESSIIESPTPSPIKSPTQSSSQSPTRSPTARSKKVIRRRNPQLNRVKRQPRRVVKKPENDEEEEFQAKSKRSVKPRNQAINRNKRQTKQNSRRPLNNENIQNDEIEISRSKSIKAKSLAANKGKRQVKLAASAKNFSNQNNNENNDDGVVINNNKNVRNKSPTMSRSQKPVKQAVRKFFPNQNNDQNENEENGADNEVNNRRNIKQRNLQMNKNRKTVIKKPLPVQDEEEDYENDFKNKKTMKQKSPQTNKNRKTIKKNQINNNSDIEDDDLDNQEENIDFQQQTKNDNSSDLDESFDRTEVNDTFMNVTVGVNDLNNDDEFETYETYEIFNQFVTPRHAKSPNLNRNISSNKNKNKNVDQNQNKNAQNRNRNVNNVQNKKQIKSNDNECNENNDDFQLSPKIRNLINDFSTQYNLNDFDIIFQGFETPFNNSDFWVNINDELSIDKLYNNVKIIKETNS